MRSRERRFTRWAVAATLAFTAGPAAAVGGDRLTGSSPPTAAAAGGMLARAVFEPNVGQDAAGVAFLTRVAGGVARFTTTGLHLTLPTTATRDVTDSRPAAGTSRPQATTLRLAFVAPAADAAVQGINATETRLNFLLGNDPSRWRPGVATYAGIRYDGLWPGVDLAYGAGAGPLKGTYYVEPHRSPDVIRWRYPDAEVRLDGDALRITAPGGATILEQAPVAWQDTAAGRVAVPTRYRLAADGSVGFTVGRYDNRRPLVIDPELVWSRAPLAYALSFAGVSDVAIDPAGEVIVAGEAWSATGNGADELSGNARTSTYGGGPSDGFVAKYTRDGQLRWLTYLGGSGQERLDAVDVAPDGRIAVTGRTGSPNYPTVNPSDQRAAESTDNVTDAVLTVLDPAGSRLHFSTYLSSPGYDAGWAVRVGRDRSLTVIGTSQPNYSRGAAGHAMQPTRGAYRAGVARGFVARYSASGRLLWRATVGPTRLYNPTRDTIHTDNDSRDALLLAGGDVTATGEVYLAGYSASPYAPTTADALQRKHTDTTGNTRDGYVAKLSADGRRLLWASFLGGPGRDGLVDLGLAPGGALWLLGHTDAAAFPQRRPVRNRPCLTATAAGRDPRVALSDDSDTDATVIRLDSRHRLDSATCLGGSGYDFPGLGGNPVAGLAVDRSGNVYVTGATCSLDFPVQQAWQPYRGSADNSGRGQCDSFAASFDPRGGLRWSSPLGGSRGEAGDRGGIAVGAAGQVVLGGATNSQDYPGLRRPGDLVGPDVGSAVVTMLSER